MKLIRSPKAKRFVALSYMWQNTANSSTDQGHLTRANLAALEAVGGLEGLSLPSNVSDAIALCRALRERFLWVDRLCIVQDDAESKHSQINAMDVIYTSATFTIMAALHVRQASTGLPGCPALPGCPGRARISSAMDPWIGYVYDETRRVHSGFNGGDDAVALSAWNRRGWTFQERVLSRRRLYITESQVMWQCQQGSAFEHLSHPSRNRFPYMRGLRDEMLTMKSMGSRSGDATLPPSAKIWRKVKRQVRNGTVLRGFNDVGIFMDAIIFHKEPNRMDLQDYEQCVSGYTTRQLSFRSDMLNAFHGVGNVLARALGTTMLFGLPQRYIHVAMLWTTRVSSATELTEVTAESATAYAPSWSWASSHSPVAALSAWDRSSSSLTLIHFHYFDIPQSELDHSVPRKIHAQNIRACYFGARSEWVGPGLLLEFFSHIPRVLDQTACNISRGLSGSLIFNTATIQCHLRSPDSNKRHGLTRALLVHSTGQSMGRAVIDADTDEGRLGSEKKVEVKLVVIDVRLLMIMIRIDEKSTMSARNQDGDHPACVDVLLVEPEPRKPGAVRRFGLGRVDNWELWLACTPQWETVVLA